MRPYRLNVNIYFGRNGTARPYRLTVNLCFERKGFCETIVMVLLSSLVTSFVYSKNAVNDVGFLSSTHSLTELLNRVFQSVSRLMGRLIEFCSLGKVEYFRS